MGYWYVTRNCNVKGYCYITRSSNVMGCITLLSLQGYTEEEVMLAPRLHPWAVQRITERVQPAARESLHPGVSQLSSDSGSMRLLTEPGQLINHVPPSQNGGVVNGEGREGSRERGLMNTGSIDLLTGLLSLARHAPSAAPALCWAATARRRTKGSRRGAGGRPAGGRRAQVMAEGSSSLDPSFPTKPEAEGWTLLGCPVPEGRRFLARRSWCRLVACGHCLSAYQSLYSSIGFMIGLWLLVLTVARGTAARVQQPFSVAVTRIHELWKA